MNVSKNTLNREDNLNLDELEALAEEIRMVITNGRSYGIREYVSIVSSMDFSRFGYRKGRAILFEPKLESYFADVVFDALKEIGRKEHNHKFNKEDDDLIKKNIHRGLEWLKNRFYTDHNVIYNRIVELNLLEELSSTELSCLKEELDETLQGDGQEYETHRVDGGIV